MAWEKELKKQRADLYDCDQEHSGSDSSSDGYQQAILPYYRNTHNMERNLPLYMEAMKIFISTFCYLPQLVGLKPLYVTKSGKDSTCFMCPCGGNIHA